MPIFAVVQTVLLMGIVGAVYISIEYEKHNERIRFLNLVGHLAEAFSAEHTTLFDTDSGYHRLTPATQNATAKLIRPMVLNDGATLVVITYGKRRHVFFKGMDRQQAMALTSPNGPADRPAALPANWLEANRMPSVSFSTDPPGRFSMTSAAHSTRFVIDFVANKVWPLVLVAIVLSFLITAALFRFVRGRYNEVSGERSRFLDFAASSSDNNSRSAVSSSPSALSSPSLLSASSPSAFSSINTAETPNHKRADSP